MAVWEKSIQVEQEQMSKELSGNQATGVKRVWGDVSLGHIGLVSLQGKE